MLLFQRDEEVIVIWSGRAGDYLGASNRAAALLFPPRVPSSAEREAAGRTDPRPRRSTYRSARALWREQRSARGLCWDCPNVTDDEHVRCRSCRLDQKSSVLAFEGSRRR